MIPILIALPVWLVAVDPGADPAPASLPALTQPQASAFARLALRGLSKEYPGKPEHVLAGPADVQAPRALHPAFFGCYDWHSSVHGHWMLVRLLRLYPQLPEAAEIRAALNDHLTAENLKAEAHYFARKESRPFERPYGWAWLLKLAEELNGWDDADARHWAENLRPLADTVVARYLEFFPKQTYPIRTGVHPNTAFGLACAHDYARATGNARLQELVAERARSYFSADADAPAHWEPGGNDFFSPTLMEADLMRRVVPPADFRAWFARFLPGAGLREPKSLFTPATVTDRTDPQLVHLDGLNLSRAWCMRGIAAALPADDPAGRALLESAAEHAQAGLEHVASGDYAGEHWLASFAVYLLTARAGGDPLATGREAAEHGRWAEAVAAFSRAAEERPNDHEPRYLLALAQLAAGDEAGYRRTCAAALERFGAADDPRVASPIAYTCVALPRAVDDPARLVRVAEKAVPLFKGNERVLGAALYRAGRHHEALRQLEAASRLTTPVAWDWLFLSMIHQRLGHADQAQSYLKRAVAWIEQADRKQEQHRGAPRTTWFNWNEPVEVKHLRKEAEDLLRAR